jgi:hypothetical protein
MLLYKFNNIYFLKDSIPVFCLMSYSCFFYKKSDASSISTRYLYLFLHIFVEFHIFISYSLIICSFPVGLSVIYFFTYFSTYFFIYCFIYFIIYSFIYFFIYSFIYSFIYFFIYSFIYL